MMDFDTGALLTQASAICLGVLALVFGLCFLRLRRGPSLADRVVALDVMTTVLMGLFAVFAIYSRQEAYIDVTMVLALIAFVTTINFARHIERDSKNRNEKKDANL